MRRGQRVCASAAGQKPTAIASALHGAPQPVRNVIHACDVQGLACLPRGSNVPRRVEPVLNVENREHVRALLPRSPRNFGRPARVWTLKWLADVCPEQGLRPTTLSWPTRLDALVRLDVNGQGANPWMVRPDPAYALKKATRAADPASRQTSRPRPGL